MQDKRFFKLKGNIMSEMPVSLEIEISNLKNLLTNSNAEKTALDSMYGESMVSNLQLRTKCVMMQSLINDLSQENAKLKSDLEIVKCESEVLRQNVKDQAA